MKIGKNVWIGRHVFIDADHPEAVTIGDNSTIGLRTSIFTHLWWESESNPPYQEVIIEKNAYVGPHCIILMGVRIGEGAVIKAGSVITHNVPSCTFWGPPEAKSLGLATVPLTSETGYEGFVYGLRHVTGRKRNTRAR